jgi:hypothetical protein
MIRLNYGENRVKQDGFGEQFFCVFKKPASLARISPWCKQTIM